MWLFHSSFKIPSTKSILTIQALQTPKQRASNEKFAKKNLDKQGKPRKTEEKVEIPVSKTWLFVLLFLVIGGGVLELIRFLF
ncbi:hypothetical protein G9P44_000723 [Scheffersomyces stipitis]|nr:hypothetical protein G9P44_000723 [Scheffersomyces stipitis]